MIRPITNIRKWLKKRDVVICYSDDNQLLEVFDDYFKLKEQGHNVRIHKF